MKLVSSFGIPRLFRPSIRRRTRMQNYILIFLISITLILPFYIIYKPPALVFAFFHYRFPSVLFSTSPRKGELVVALTIDDSPTSETQSILKVLAKHDAHATFFVIGNRVNGNEEVLESIVRQKSELANHAMSDTPSTSLPSSTLKLEIDRVNGLLNHVYEKLGLVRKARYFRPGSGFFTREMLEVVKEAGYRLVLGSIYPHDAQIHVGWLNSRHVLSMVKSGGIIILHDGRRATAGTLDTVLGTLKKRGYRVVTATELLASSAKTVP